MSGANRDLEFQTILHYSLKRQWCKAPHIHLHPTVGKNRVACICGLVHQERYSRRLICVSTILANLEGSMFNFGFSEQRHTLQSRRV